MSRDITYRIETKDEDGNWNLLSWFAEYEYNGISAKSAIKIFFSSFSISRYKMVKKICGKDYSVNYFSNIWKELQKLCRYNSRKPKSYTIAGEKLMKKNWFSEGACCFSDDIEELIGVHNGIPQDASLELEDALKEDEIDSDGYKYHYIYKYFTLRELQNCYEKEIDKLFVELDNASIKTSNAIDHITIMKKLERIENIILNKEETLEESLEKSRLEKQLDKQSEEYGCFDYNREQLEYLQTEKFWDIIALIRLNNYVTFLTEYVKTGYISADNIRIIYYIS